MTDLQAEHLGPVEIKHVGSATVTVLSRRLRRVRWDRRIHVGSAGSSHAGLSAHEAGIHQSPVWWCRVSRTISSGPDHPRPGARRTNRKPNHHRLPSPVRRTPAGSPARSESGAGRRGRRLSPGHQPVKPKPLKPVRARRCRPSSRSLWGVRIGSFNRRSKRRLSGGRPGRADRGWNLEAVVTGSTRTDPARSPPARPLCPPPPPLPPPLPRPPPAALAIPCVFWSVTPSNPNSFACCSACG